MDRDLAVQSQQQESERERAGGREREKERKTGRKKDTGTQALMEKECFNDLCMSIYRLLKNFFDNDKDQKTKSIVTVTKERRN